VVIQESTVEGKAQRRDGGVGYYFPKDFSFDYDVTHSTCRLKDSQKPYSYKISKRIKILFQLPTLMHNSFIL